MASIIDFANAIRVKLAEKPNISDLPTWTTLVGRPQVAELVDGKIDPSVLPEGGGGGADGASAYEIAVDNGFVGSESEWLASLKGEPGDTGTGGEAGPLAEFTGLPADPVPWLPHQYRVTSTTTLPGSIVWATGDPEIGGWGIIILVWDGAAWRGEWAEMGPTPPGGASPTEVTATGPTFTDDAENGGGTWTTPTETGITYTPASGTAAPDQQVTVTATAQTGYTITGSTSWSHAFPPASGALAGAVLALSPTAYWPLDDASGTAVADASGNGWTGILEGVEGADYAREAGGGIRFIRTGTGPTATSGRVRVPRNVALVPSPANGYTVFCVARRDDSFVDAAYIVASPNATARDFHITASLATQLNVGWRTTAGGWVQRPAPFAAGNERRIAFTIPPGATAGPGAVLNGNASTLAVTGTPDGTIRSQGGDITIGGGGFAGAVRHVAIFSRELTPTEIQTLMNAAE